MAAVDSHDGYALEGDIPVIFHQTNNVFLHSTPKSRAASEEARKYMPGGSTRASLWSPPYGLTFASGAGSTLTDLDGRTYDDFLGEYSAGIFGHNNSKIRAAIDEALSQGWNFGGQSRHEQALSKAVVERFSPVIDLVRFTNSGTEANTMALATALAWHHTPRHQQSEAKPQRHKIVVFDGAYHGGTLRFPKFGKQTSETDKSARPDDPVNLPHDFVVAPFNDVRGTEELLARHTNEIAAVLIEPMQGNGGARLATRVFLSLLKDFCHESGAILILDEVQSSRLGPQGYGAHLGVKADLLTLGKWVGGGMTFGAFGGRRDLMAQWDLSPAGHLAREGKRPALAHAGTFNNNVISMAAGLAGIKILTPERMEMLNERGNQLRLSVHRVLADMGFGTENDMWIQGEGSILAVQFAGTWKAQLHAAWFQYMLEQGIYFSPRGYMCLSIEVSEDQISKFVHATKHFVEEFSEYIGIQEA